jgi:hypothetical protein
MKTERELVSCKYRGFSCSDLHKYFHLDIDTGDIYHKERFDVDFNTNRNPIFSARAWNNKWAGKKAGTVNNSTGYIEVKLNNIKLKVHRVVYLMFNGYMDQGLLIDLIDGNRINNIPLNLRAVNQSENSQNQRKSTSRSKLGVLGVSQTSSGKHQARLGLDGKDTYLGSFLTISDAEVAYLEAKKILHINQDYKAMIGASE